ncbi:MAG: DUF1579 domain-containing protein [Chitinophagaceae bacterium]|nr:MAG: DUF1579 domain-containing protein [Chitinophagaceae bacterium]
MKLIVLPALVATLAFTSCADNANKKATTETTTASNMDSSAAMDAPIAETPAAPAPDSATMMKNWQEYMAPGDMHKMMESWSGKWTGDVIMWQAPGAPADTMKGTAVNKMTLGGRYMTSTHTSTMMGMPFEGHSTMGYDNAKKLFVNTWIDNAGTGIMYLEGPYDAATKTITLTGKCVDPSAGNGKEMTVRQVIKEIDPKHQVMEMYGPGPDGKEFKMMEVHSMRS